MDRDFYRSCTKFRVACEGAGADALQALKDWVARKSQAEVARHLGVSGGYLHDILGGRRPIQPLIERVLEKGEL